MSSSSDMPAVETLVGAGAVGETGRLGAVTRGAAATGGVAVTVAALAPGPAGRVWTTGVTAVGATFLVETRGASACGAIGRGAEAIASGAVVGAGDATGAMGAGMMAAGRTPAAPTGSGAVGGLHAFDGDAGGAAAGTAAPARKRVSACPGNVVAIDAPITTVASQATATPNQPRPLDLRASMGIASSIGTATGGSNAGDGRRQRGAVVQVGCATLASDARRGSDRARRMTSSNVSA
jgi:hypothetical protein